LIWIGGEQRSEDWDECEIAVLDARFYPDDKENIIMPALSSSLSLTLSK
jgi:hypothetical protein